MSQNSPAKNRATLFDLDGVPPMGQAIPMALQHVVAMIVGCVTPALIIGNIPQLALTQEMKVLLIQSSLVIAAISTLLQVLPIGKKGGFRFGSGLPVIIGISFAYLPSLQGISTAENGMGLAYIAGSMVVGGIIATLTGFFIKPIRKYFPPIITGTVIFTIGLSLYPTAVNYMAGGAGNTLAKFLDGTLVLKTQALTYGSWQNWVVALITLAVTTSLNHWAKGIAKLASILLGMVAGYLVAMAFGMVDFSKVAAAGNFALPQLMPYGFQFELGSAIAIGLLFFINSIQAIGDFTGTTVGGMDREPTDDELQGGIVCYGVTNLAAAFFGGLPSATYSQNVGIVVTTKVVNRLVFALASVLILAAGIFPKFSALLTTIPQCVLGGATITVFSMIAMTGIKLIVSQEMNYRNMSIVGLSVALGVGIWQAAASIGQFPEVFTTIFGKSPVVVATLMALLLNQILPNPDKKKKEA